MGIRLQELLALHGFLATFAQNSGMKILLTIALLYLAYRFFFARPAIQGPSSNRDAYRPDPEVKANRPKTDKNDYIDYEEVD